MLLETIQNILKASCKGPDFLSNFNHIWIFSTDLDFLCTFTQKPSISNLTEVCPVGSALIRMDRWTDIMKALSANM